MITIFNRKELLSTFNMQEQADIRRLLTDNKIDYYVKIINRKSPSPFSGESRSIVGTFGERLEFEYEYMIYVKKVDFEKAMLTAYHPMEKNDYYGNKRN